MVIRNPPIHPRQQLWAQRPMTTSDIFSRSAPFQFDFICVLLAHEVFFHPGPMHHVDCQIHLHNTWTN
jgi:hypothetical protein